MKRATKQPKRKASQSQRIPSTLEYHQADVDPVPPARDVDTSIVIHCDGLHYWPSKDLAAYLRDVLKNPRDPLKRYTDDATW